MVIWLTGLSGAGKTTIAEAIVREIKPRLPELVLIDGDVIRELFGAGLGFHEEARQEQIGRIQRLAMFLARQNIVVVVAALYSHPDLLRWNRANLPGYYEIYVNAPLPLVEKRDTKGLYSKARSGEMQNMVGVDIPWHAPENPDMVVNSGSGETPEAIAIKIIQAAPCLAAALAHKLMSGGQRDINHS
ncbi:MAG: adenylyl-sulfate kinase [Gallionella sp.]|nr:adenylyl-sulfate kinase [Gallionella sp.]